MPVSDKDSVAAIVGPTAVGKTEVSLSVAETLGAEIVSIDSMQIYRRMDIGTDKAGAEERARVPHHLVDLWEPEHELSVAEYQRLARSAIEDVIARGKLPLLVGGSGLYLRAVVDDLRFPPTDPDVRALLDERAQSEGVEALFETLRDLDPIAAERIEPNNERRIVRALEVIELTGRPFSDNDSWSRFESIYDLAIVGLDRDRGDLDSRINSRVGEMFRRGLRDEIAALGSLGRTARAALAYKQVLDRPQASDDDLIDEIAKATRRFARRQLSWFRSDPRIVWLDAAREDLEAQVVDHFVRSLTLRLQP
jgi:tRNA dimethylallyltransferase